MQQIVTFLLGHWPLIPGVIAVIALVLWASKWCLAASGERFRERKELLQLWAQVFGGAAVLLGVFMAWQQIQVARKDQLIAREEQVIAREGQITERFTRAIDQLGSDKLQVRLGGIYALERIAKDYEKDHWTVMEVLTAYVRESAPWKEKEQQKDEPDTEDRSQKVEIEEEMPTPDTDVQAVLTVIGRRKWIDKEEEGQSLDFRGADIRGAFLAGAHLEGAFLVGAHLEGANLAGAHLEGAILAGAHLERAILWGAHLERAILMEANLEGAILGDAHLERAMLLEANLEGAILMGAHLEGAILTDAHLEGAILTDVTGLTQEQINEWPIPTDVTGLTQAQINEAIGDEKTKLPEGLQRPPHWSGEAKEPGEAEGPAEEE